LVAADIDYLAVTWDREETVVRFDLDQAGLVFSFRWLSILFDWVLYL
jgi:hypothetical protein